MIVNLAERFQDRRCKPTVARWLCRQITEASAPAIVLPVRLAPGPLAVFEDGPADQVVHLAYLDVLAELELDVAGASHSSTSALKSKIPAFSVDHMLMEL